MIRTGAISVRLRNPGEKLPEALRTEFELCRIDPEWHWLVEHNGEVVASMLCANAHGMLLLLRMNAIAKAPKSWSLLALRRVLSDARERGCLGYLVMLEDSNPQEVKLMRIAMRAGAVAKPVCGALLGGSVEIGY